jgi:hypothetical protein
MKSTLGIVLVLAAAGAAAGADLSLDAAGGTVYVTAIDGSQAVEDVHAPDGRHLRLEVIPTGASPQPIHRISHTHLGLAVHAGAGGSAPLTTALFRQDSAGSLGTYVLRDPGTGAITRPSAVRTVVLDPGDPGAALLDASHVLLPQGGPLRALALVRRSAGEAILLDYDVAGGPVRRTPLGFTAPLGSTKGSFVAGPDGQVWAAVASPGGIRLFDLGGLSSTEALEPAQKAVIAGGAGFDPGSTRLGIIAILIGLVAQPAPAVSYQRGDELIVSVLEGEALRTVVRQALPSDALGLMADEGLFSFFYLLPYIEQENLYRGVVGRNLAEPR